MKKISLMKWMDSNIAGYEWVINIVLTQRKNKLYSVRAIQVADEPPVYKTPLIYPIRNGTDLKTSIKKVFEDDLISHKEINWTEILDNLSKNFPDLYQELSNSLHTIQSLDNQRNLSTKELDLKIAQWVDKAAWPKSTSRDPLGLSRNTENSRRRMVIEQFVKKYIISHNQLPKGEHMIDEIITVKDQTHSNAFIKVNLKVLFPKETDK